MDNKTLSLTWEGSYTIKDKELYNEEKPGLYLFTVKTDSFYSVHYIGMTTRGLSSRIVGTGSTTGHLRDYVSGRYYLYNFKELKNLHIKAEYSLKDNFETFFADLEKYQTIARHNLEAINFYICPFDDHFELIEIAESILINHIFSCMEAERKEVFPIIDNSYKITNKIYNHDLTIVNVFPDGCTVMGLMSPIVSPYEK